MRIKKLAYLLLFTILIMNLVACDVTGTTQTDREAVQTNMDTEPVTLEWYIHYSWYNAEWGENRVSQTITEKTGVNLEFIIPSGSEREHLAALIASDNLPDFISIGWWEPQLVQIIDSGMVYALNELADTYDTGFFDVAHQEQLDWYRKADGNVYCYPNSSYTPSDYEKYDSIASNQTFLVRKDIYEAIGKPDMTTPEGFIEAVERAVEMFPTVNGKPLIPVGTHEFNEFGSDSFSGYLMNFLAIPFEKDGKYYDRTTDSSYITWLKTFRELYQHGYISDDVFIDKRMQMEEKILEGRYFSMIYQRTDYAEQQKYIFANYPERAYIAIDGPKNANGNSHKLPGGGINGWTTTMISKSCEHPDKAISFMSFLMGEEGQKLTYLGVEGIDYNMVGNKPVLTPQTDALFTGDYQSYVKEVGGNNVYWMLQDGVMISQWEKSDNENLNQMQQWARQYTVYTGQYDVNLPPQSHEFEIDNNIKKLWGNALPALLTAKDEAEFDRIFNDFLGQRERLGFSLIIQESEKQFAINKKKLGLE